ncbi:MAG: nucleoside-diphosphate kinase [Thermodesulfobacteria bacterium]|nr:nucleoside-diphosphate kinase [Thermodesulfobacteriota bacterium]
MAVERTLSMIKPDGVSRDIIGEVLSFFEKGGLKIVAMKMLRLTKQQAEEFYIVHKGKPFYDELTDYMSSGPIVALVLEGEDAIAKCRKIMGATDPAEADEGTIRKTFALSKGENTVHGSDSPESAAREIAFFFSELEICPR